MDEKILHEELKILEETYRGAVPELKFDSPFELLVAVILSAQCTDKRVNQVTQVLFPLANTPEKILRLGQSRLEEIIKPCGYFRAKAKHIFETSKILLESYGGEVPRRADKVAGRRAQNCKCRDKRRVQDTCNRRRHSRLPLVESVALGGREDDA